MVNRYGKSPMGGNAVRPSISTGTRPLKGARFNSTGCAERDRFATHKMLSSPNSRKYARILRFPGLKKRRDPRPKDWLVLRTASRRLVQLSSELGSRDCASTLVDWYPYTASMMGGRYKRWGSARAHPALRSGLHCIGVRAPSGSPSKKF